MNVPVRLGEIQETLLIPLYGRAQDAAARRSVLHDTRSAELVAALDYDFPKFKGASLAGSVLRASIVDEYVRDFLRSHPDGTVVDLGCGLSTRFDRLDNGSVRWFDLDLPDTMALRRNFFPDAERYTQLDGSIFDDDWHEVVTAHGGPLLLLSEAVLLYFSDDEVRALLRRLATRFAGSDFALDTAGPFMINHQEQNSIFDTVAARMQWICADPRSLGVDGWALRDSHSFGRPQRTVGATWPWKYRLLLTALRPTPMVSGYRMNLFRAEPPAAT